MFNSLTSGPCDHVVFVVNHVRPRRSLRRYLAVISTRLIAIDMPRDPRPRSGYKTPSALRPFPPTKPDRYAPRLPAIALAPPQTDALRRRIPVSTDRPSASSSNHCDQHDLE